VALTLLYKVADERMHLVGLWCCKRWVGKVRWRTRIYCFIS